MLNLLGQSSIIRPKNDRHILDNLQILGRQPGTIPVIVKGAPNQNVNLQDWRDSLNAVKAYVKISSSLGFIGASRLEFVDDPTNRFLTSTTWNGNNQIKINCSAGIWLTNDNSQGWIIGSNTVLTAVTSSTGNKNYTIQGFDQDSVASRGVCSLTLKGGNASSSAAAGGNQAGSQLILQGGLGTGSGTPGPVQLQAGTALGSGTTLQSYSTVLEVTNANLITFSDAVNILLNTTTGTKIGTATGQKLGFWNATPVVQQVLATGAAHTVDDVITLLQTIGLCKQS